MRQETKEWIAAVLGTLAAITVLLIVIILAGNADRRREREACKIRLSAVHTLQDSIIITGVNPECIPLVVTGVTDAQQN